MIALLGLLLVLGLGFLSASGVWLRFVNGYRVRCLDKSVEGYCTFMQYNFGTECATIYLESVSLEVSHVLRDSIGPYWVFSLHRVLIDIGSQRSLHER